eukprot:jgi/Picsp_1/182/NSC_00182-R1_upf0553 family protein
MDVINLRQNPCSLVRESAQWVAEQSSHVSIDDSAISSFVASRITAEEAISICKGGSLDYNGHFVDTSRPELTSRYFLVLDAVNFCFFPHSNLEYENLSRGLKRSVEDNPDCLNLGALTSIKNDELCRLFRVDCFPLGDERARLVREVASQLIAYHEGSMMVLVEKAESSAVKLVEMITRLFPGFRDHAVYRGRQIFFLKRAQILVADLSWALHDCTGFQFRDLDELTMFPDYRVPVVLRELDILRYSPGLSELVDNKKCILPGTEYEVEIRSNSIIAVERIKEAIRSAFLDIHPEINPFSIHIDWFLWDIGERDQSKHRPHHRTLTIFY